MKITFPAMRAKMGGREYYSTTMALSEIPRFFKFNDWEQFTPELRAQRVLNESRVPVMAKYVVDNEDSYLFSSITCSFAGSLAYSPFSESNADIGEIQLDLEDMEFVINDGQHRCAAIAQAIRESPSVAHDRISVLLFPMESLERMQQMFSDLNRYAQRTAKSLNILYDQRDPLGSLTTGIVEEVPVFSGLVDFEKVSLPVQSHKLFTLTSIYDANKELIARFSRKGEMPDYEALQPLIVEYWTHLAGVIADWTKAAKGEIPPPALRQEKISTHAVVLRALGSVGGLLLAGHPNDWKNGLANFPRSIGERVSALR